MLFNQQCEYDPIYTFYLVWHKSAFQHSIDFNQCITEIKKKKYLPIPAPERLNCDAFNPRPFLATSPKSHPSPYL